MKSPSRQQTSTEGLSALPRRTHSTSIIWRMITHTHKKTSYLRLSALLTTEHCLQKRWRQKPVMRSSCLCVGVGAPWSLHGQVCHSESAHSLHCGAGQGPNRVRAGWHGASWIKTVAANRKWVCEDKISTAKLSVYERAPFFLFPFFSSHFNSHSSGFSLRWFHCGCGPEHLVSEISLALSQVAACCQRRTPSTEENILRFGVSQQNQ